MSNDLWRTPPEVIDYIQRRFGLIEIDLCSSDENSVCSFNLNKEEDFLNNYWIHQSLINHGDLAWLNPPYSNPLPFVKQAIKWSEAGYSVAGILNNDTSTKWFCELQKAAAILMPITGGRIAFLDEYGQPINGNNKPQVMFYLAPFGSHTQTTEYVSIDEIYPNGKPRKSREK